MDIVIKRGMVFFTAHPVYVSRTRLNAFSESWIGGKIESQRFFLLANMYNFEIETPINFASIQPSQFTSLLLSFFFSRSVSVFENSVPPPKKGNETPDLPISRFNSYPYNPSFFYSFIYLFIRFVFAHSYHSASCYPPHAQSYI